MEITKEVQNFLNSRRGDIQVVKRCSYEGKMGYYTRYKKGNLPREFRGKCIGAYYTLNKKWGGTVYKNEAYIIRLSSGKLVSSQIFYTKKMWTKKALLVVTLENL